MRLGKEGFVVFYRNKEGKRRVANCGWFDDDGNPSLNIRVDGGDFPEGYTISDVEGVYCEDISSNPYYIGRRRPDEEMINPN